MMRMLSASPRWGVPSGKRSGIFSWLKSSRIRPSAVRRAASLHIFVLRRFEPKYRRVYDWKSIFVATNRLPHAVSGTQIIYPLRYFTGNLTHRFPAWNDKDQSIYVIVSQLAVTSTPRFCPELDACGFGAEQVKKVFLGNSKLIGLNTH